MTGKIAFVLKGYPRLSETFIAQEILALEQRGFDIVIVSLRHPTDKDRHPVHEKISASVLYLPEYLYQEPARVWRALRWAWRQPGFSDARRCWRDDLARDRSPNRVRRFGQALVLAHELGEQVSWLHAHFLHTPASVTRYAATIVGKPWSCSAHAKDIWTIDDWEKREKLADLQWLVTCTRANAEHLGTLAPSADRVALVYHGIDLERFRVEPTARKPRDGAHANDPVRLLSVGRAVAKKGYDILLRALADLDETLHFRFSHIGGGSELDALRQLAESLGLQDRIEWLGPMAQPAVIERYQQADIFVLPSRITEDGDRDGLPNVLMEAQAHGLACLSSNVSGIPELVDDGVTGILTPENDVESLRTALSDLIKDPSLRERIGEAGRTRVYRDFDMTTGIDDLERRFSTHGR